MSLKPHTHTLQTEVSANWHAVNFVWPKIYTIYTYTVLVPHILEHFWQGSGPLFFYSGNEAPIEEFYDNSGFIFELAQDFDALIVFGEHVSDVLCVYIPDFFLQVGGTLVIDN